MSKKSDSEKNERKDFEKKPAPFITKFSGFIFLFAGIFLISMDLNVFLFETIDALKWKETPCKIVSAELQGKMGTIRTKISYRINVSYKYFFKEKKYTSEKFNFNNNRIQDYDAEKASSYKAGEESLCYVNPRNPSEAVLDRSLPPGAYTFLLAGFILICLSFMIFKGKKK